MDYSNSNDVVFKTEVTFKKLSEINFNLVYSALRRYNVLKFDVLKNYFPNLTSIKEFIESEKYLGNIKMIINSDNKKLTNVDFYNCILSVLNKIKNQILIFDEKYEGTKEFKSVKFNEIFKDKIGNVSNPGVDSVGISQKYTDDESLRLDLSDKDWYIYTDNYGTTEEKKLLNILVIILIVLGKSTNMFI